ncbi:hypothetical protein PPTG_12225 [Phytophthora nicotianae INRA-310]|uniref:Uncharacterized protein n=1 Tax=Phytophthora nicotianae (strain INRA-310) TaxID=761204 RepID=W2Q835_PHYN3|nr:hypothetical protein PPTG_12225 [Phytophthora nicotianae INRA-310]ETN08430.1 hypothetical protein PPTG_12225 [Phytophthora nicotianae INRA-310]
MTPIRAGRQTLGTVAIAATSFQTTWMLVRAVETPLGSVEEDINGDVGEQEPFDALGVSGDAVTPTSADIPGTQKTNVNAEALILVTDAPTAAPIATQVAANEMEKLVNPKKEEEATLNLDNATVNQDKDAPAPAETASVLEVLNTEAPTTEAPTTEAPTEPMPSTIEPVAIVDTTKKPSLRTQDPAVISDVVTNGAAETQAPGYLSQGSNPLVLVALAGFCCIFLLLWGRKRRSSAPTSSGTPGNTSLKGPKVQYTQVPDEQPFSHSQDDDDEYCDDYEEDTFANDRDNWDDWEGNSTQTQVPQLNPFIAVPSAPRPTTPRQGNSSPNPFKITQPLPPPPPQQNVQLQEISVAGKGDLLPSSVESNSSSDSFEVVTDEAHAPPTSNRGVTAEAEKEDESVDDLFSQFGMVPTFKKSAVVPPLPAATSAAPVAQPGTAAPSSSSSLPTAAEASALFAAEMDDDLSAVDEWGEDDEWVKGI